MSEENENLEEQNQELEDNSGGDDKVIPVSGMYENWFLDYASYVILERAVPALIDGFKPVQRRIMHSMKEMDDGRFHKVANIIGQTMQYHPHGDAAIGDALVNMGQKELMIETQGNWGDVNTGDSAAAPRYIEARLSKFALEVAFNKELTKWQLSYDGRKQEPVNLPVKFPLLLAQGAEGIAVGLATKILPHNFIELLKGSIDIIKGKKVKIFPDFPTGGQADFSDYNEGLKGGKVKVRVDMEVVDKKTISIKSVPYGSTTTQLIDSIIKANDKGKIKIKKIIDNTAEFVEIIVEIPSGVSPELTMDALFAFTDCESSISPNSCVIIDNKPHFLSVNEMLRLSTESTRDVLVRELEWKLAELKEKWHFASLEKIFIENRIYRDIEECETWEAVIETIDKGLEPFKKIFYREITKDDIVRLTEIKIKRISKFDSFKADELIAQVESDIKETEHHLAHIDEYAINYFQGLIDKYGKGRERKTEIKSFDVIQATQVAAANIKLYVNREEGFIGYGLKKDEFVCECSDIDDIITFRKDGVFMVTKVADKTFVGKGIIEVHVWKKGNERMVYNMAYFDPKSNRNYVKRFNVNSIIRDKEYNLTPSDKGAKVLHFTANPNSESEVIQVTLSQQAKARNKVFDFDFGDLDIKGKGAKGNTLTKYPVRKIVRKELGASTLGGRGIWLDETVGRLNTSERGKFLGEFDTDDRILVIYKSGFYELTDFELTNRYNMEEIERIVKFNPKSILTCVHKDGEKKGYYVKRFSIETSTLGQQFPIISESPGSKMILITLGNNPVFGFSRKKGKSGEKVEETVEAINYIDVKGWKARGNKLGDTGLAGFHWVEEGQDLNTSDDRGESKAVENVPDDAESSVEETKPPKLSEEPMDEKTDNTPEPNKEEKSVTLEWDKDGNPLPKGEQGKLF